MITPRTRSRYGTGLNVHDEYNSPFGHYSYDLYYNSSFEKCVDVLGNYPNDNPLTLTKFTYDGGQIAWKQGYYSASGQLGYPFNVTDSSGADVSSYLSPITAQKIAASTAPLKPAVYTLTNLLELRDIPIMLKDAGDLLLKIITRPTNINPAEAIASNTLAYLFGWAPLIQDLTRVLDFGRLVADRQKEIGDLSAGKTVRRRLNFGSISGSSSGSAYFHSTTGILIPTTYHEDWSLKVWGTARWAVNDLRGLDLHPTWLQAFSSLYRAPDLGEIAVQVWKALPWSWMIDWFANLSDALEVSRNLISYHPVSLCKMWQIDRHVVWHKVVAGPEQAVSELNLTHTRKNRASLSVGDATGIHLNVPFLGPFKLSVLGSLTILKILHGNR